MKIDIKVPNGKCGVWEVKEFKISEYGAKSSNLKSAANGSGRFVYSGIYKALMCGNEVVMSNTQSEISDHIEFINIAKTKKSILINGLGLGVALSEILKSKTVEDITVIEKFDDVIKLVSDTYNDPRVKIIKSCAYEYKMPKGKYYDCVWHDIWTYICSDNLKGMEKLHRKYGKRTKWQGSWCKKLCKKLKSRNN